MRSTVQLILVSVIFFHFISPSYAQVYEKRFATNADAVKDTALKIKKSTSCNRPSSYLPDSLHPEFTPLRYVRISIHVMQDGKGANNFAGEEGKKYIHQMVDAANAVMEKNSKMFLPAGNNTAVLRVPFKYVLTGDPKNPDDDGIYFHRDDSLFCMNKKATGKQLNNVYDRRPYEQYGFRKDTVINIFLLEHCPDSIKSKTYKASNDGIGNGAWAKLVGCYHLWKFPVVYEDGTSYPLESWAAAGLFNHELGHCLGIQHTWNQDDGCDDTPNNPGCWNFGSPGGCTEVSNNVMDYNAYKNAYSPCQISKMCLQSYNDKQARKFLVNDWCTFDESKSMIIQSGETIEWFGSMDVFGNLIVANNATLIAHCTVSIPPGGKIILMPKATLILDGCTITSRCAQPFEVIEINTRKKTSPVIILKNAPKITNVVNAF
ncbi:MAG: hypothetical protein LH473_12855 [Chitinophagales bacterium]|nr:hypothetical protein [Chitinophagales bacterium]